MRTEAYFSRKSLSLKFYDAITALDPGISGDVAFYAQGLKPGESVLDFGCGTGRVTLGLAELGLKAVGVDISERMIAMAKRAAAARASDVAARAHFVVSDVTSLSLPGKYARVLCPFYILNLLPTRALRANAIRVAARHLLAGGRLIAHTLPLERLKMTGRTNNLTLPPDIVTPFEDGTKLELTWGQRIVDPGEGRTIQHVVYRHRGADGGVLDETLERLEFGWIDDREVELAATKAGLTLIETRRGFASAQEGAERIYVFHKKV